LKPLSQNFAQQELKSMPEIVYTSIMEIKQLPEEGSGPLFPHFGKWLLVIWNTLFKWETAQLDYFYCSIE